MTAEGLNKNGIRHPASNLFAADRLLDKVYGEQGQHYGDAVRRCVGRDSDQQNDSLDNAALARVVYDGAVAVLEEDKHQFFGR